MGYTTSFQGKFDIAPPLTAKHSNALRAFTDVCDVEGMPKSYCQWVSTSNDAYLEWDGSEKFLCSKWL